MKARLKATFAAITIATLAGCAAPVAPDLDKTLSKPVSIKGVQPTTVEVKPTLEGDAHKELRFTIAGKHYDQDGRLTNNDGHRVLNDGRVCVPVKLLGERGEKRWFVEKHLDEDTKIFTHSCSFKNSIDANQNKGMAIGAILLGVSGAAGAVAAIAATPSAIATEMQAADNRSSDEIVNDNNKWSSQFEFYY